MPKKHVVEHLSENSKISKASELGPETLRTFIQGLTRKEFLAGRKPHSKFEISFRT